MNYQYYNFLGRIAREPLPVNPYKDLYFRFEFYQDGQWKKDDVESLRLSDAMADYGDYSWGDYEDISEEEAMIIMAVIDKK